MTLGNNLQNFRFRLNKFRVKNFPGKLSSHPEFPDLPAPGGGSDHVPFGTFLGVPIITFTYKNATWTESYPLYHSLYETPFMNEHIFDTNHMEVGYFLPKKKQKNGIFVQKITFYGKNRHF